MLSGYITMSLIKGAATSSISSVARNASGKTTLLFALSSSVLSKSELAAFSHKILGIAAINLASEQTFSALSGFLLKGIAEDPTLLASLGSCHSPKFGACIMRKSKQNLLSDCAMEASAEVIRKSIFLGYVWPVTVASLKPKLSIMFWLNCRASNVL